MSSSFMNNTFISPKNSVISNKINLQAAVETQAISRIIELAYLNEQNQIEELLKDKTIIFDIVNIHDKRDYFCNQIFDF